MTNAAETNLFTYDADGEPLVASGPLAASFTHQFSTKPFCAVTGFSEYQMRKYNPDIGRWMSRDPLPDSSHMHVGNSQEHRFLKKKFDVTYDGADDGKSLFESQAGFAKEISNLYLFFGNGISYDIIGLFDPGDILECQQRCFEMAKHVPGNKTFLRNCILGCEKNPWRIPSIPELLTPPEIMPSWRFGDWRGNWKAILDCLKAFWEELWD